MTKIKLVNGEIINAIDVALEKNSVLKIVTTESTVEELAEMFSNKENTSLITLMTESEIESGFKTGFTSLAGILYKDGLKTIELIQPVDVAEKRISNAEGMASKAVAELIELEKTVDAFLGLGVDTDE